VVTLNHISRFMLLLNVKVRIWVCVFKFSGFLFVTLYIKSRPKKKVFKKDHGDLYVFSIDCKKNEIGDDYQQKIVCGIFF